MSGRNSSFTRNLDALTPSPTEYKPRSSRREFIALSGVAALATFLPGCGDGGPGTFDEWFASLSNTLVTIDPSNTSLGTDNGEVVSRLLTAQNLFALPRSGGQALGGNYNAVFYGTKDASGFPQRVTQSLTWFGDRNNPVRAAYNQQGLPTRGVALGTGESATFTWESNNRMVIRGFDKSGNLVGGSVIVGAGNDYTIEPLINIAGGGRTATTVKREAAASDKSRNYDYNAFTQIFQYFALAAVAAPWLVIFAADLVSHLRSGELFGTTGLGALLFGGSLTGNQNAAVLANLIMILLAVFIVYAVFWFTYASRLSGQSNRFVTSHLNPIGLILFSYLAGFR